MSEQRCFAHNEPAIANCVKCGNPICRDCKDEFGYFCSENCLTLSQQSVDVEAKEERERTMQAEQRLLLFIKLGFVAVLLLVLAWIGWWGWRTFLDPAGKPAWHCAHIFESKNFQIIDRSASALTYISGDTIQTLNPQTGKIVKDQKVPGLQAYADIDLDIPGYNLGYNTKSLTVFDKSWKTLWQKSFPDKSIVNVKGNGSLVLAALGPDWSKLQDLSMEDLRKVDRSYSITVLKADDGKQIGEKKFETVHSFSGKFCVTDKYLIYTRWGQGDERNVSYLVFDRLRDGKTEFARKMEPAITWGPMMVNGLLLVRAGSNLIALSEDGKEELWLTPCSGYFKRDDFITKGKLLFLKQTNAIICIDTQANKVLWNRAFDLSYGAELVMLGDRVYTTTTESSVVESSMKGDFKVRGSDKFKDDKFIQSFNHKGPIKRVKHVGKVSCYSLKTGKKLWDKEKLRGTLAAGNGRLVLITDTASTSRMNVANKGKGITILRQLDPDDGDVLFYRKNNFGLYQPYMILGDKLVCPEYERSSNGVPFFGMGKRSASFIGWLGFNLK